MIFGSHLDKQETMMKTLIRFFIAVAALLAAATATAQVYKCTDKDGKVQYSDIPPPADAKCASPKKIDARSAAGPGVAPAPAPAKTNSKDAPKDAKAGKDAPKDSPKTLADRTKDFDKRRADEAEAAKKAADEERVAKANQARCTEATRYLRDLESGRPLASSDDKGERVLLDDAGRATEVNRARTAMKESCK
jgi:Domain of unknown function (DUF4124)